MRKPIIAGNWKMHKTVEEAIVLANAIKRDVFDIEDVEIVLCPPFTSLGDVKDVILETNISLGAQNMHWEAEGAKTGEISSKMLKQIGCKYVIIGHSERRAYFGETNQTVNNKVGAALKEGLFPIMCVGEKLEERESGKAFDIISGHIEGGLVNIGPEEILNLVIAYEPVWAIGTGKNATPDQAQEVHKFIRGLLAKKYGKDTSEKIRIQYGGSVKPSNIESLIGEKDIDGALVGGASLKSESFVELVKKSSQVVK
ncbi:MAG: triose-phosphate isomerase [Candidatus Omnitrophica bacterium]|nr:triose-phosphate isomerase [Candidatus Omnitrophota bacterium]